MAEAGDTDSASLARRLNLTIPSEDAMLRPEVEEGASNRHYFCKSSISAFAVLRSAVAKPSVNRA